MVTLQLRTTPDSCLQSDGSLFAGPAHCSRTRKIYPDYGAAHLSPGGGGQLWLRADGDRLYRPWGGRLQSASAARLDGGHWFIGGGAILKEGVNVRGTATAASVWSTGALGAAVAYAQYEVAILISLVNYLTLRFLTPIEEQIGKSDRPARGQSSQDDADE